MYICRYGQALFIETYRNTFLGGSDLRFLVSPWKETSQGVVISLPHPHPQMQRRLEADSLLGLGDVLGGGGRGRK